MRTASLYLMRRVFLPLIALVLVVGVVVSLWQLGRISHMVLTAHRDVDLLVALIMDLAPSFAGIALGTAGLFGCVLAYDRLAEDGELTAMSAAGVGPGRIFAPAMWGGTLLGAVVLAAGVVGEPWGNSRYGRDVALLATRSFSRSLRAGSVNQIGGLASVYVGRAAVSDDGTAVWENVLVGRDLESGPVVLTTRRARVVPAGPGVLVLETEGGEAVLPADHPDVINHMRFGSASLNVDVAAWVRNETMNLYPFQTLELDDLWREAQAPSNSGETQKLRFFLWQKLAVPFGMPLLCLIGALFGGQRASTARGRGYLAAAVGIAVYFGLLNLGRNWVIQGWLPAWAGAHLPNVVAAAVLAWLWRARGTRWA